MITDYAQNALQTGVRIKLKEFAMFKWKNSTRGIPTKDGLYCPYHDKVFSSEDELEPRQHRNQSASFDFIDNRGGQRGMGRGFGRGFGRGRERGLSCWRRGRMF